MKITLSKEEAAEYVGVALIESVFPGKRMKVVSVIWKDYVDDVEIELEPDNAPQQTKNSGAGKLASSPPPAPSPRPGIETPGWSPKGSIEIIEADRPD